MEGNQSSGPGTGATTRDGRYSVQDVPVDPKGLSSDPEHGLTLGQNTTMVNDGEFQTAGSETTEQNGKLKSNGIL